MRVQIVFPTDGWILQRLAAPLLDRLPYTVGMEWEPDRKSEWDITYFINYALYLPKSRAKRLLARAPRSKLLGGWFTHREDDVFDEVARKLDFCVSPCVRYRDYIREHCNPNAHVIYHGIDLDRFKPRLRLGFVGKRHRSGRKGDEWLDYVEKLPYVELLATDGKLTDDQIPAFYRQIDYVLITSTLEGGPLCFQEGLASGKPILSTDVGMVSEFAGAPGVDIFRSREELERLLREKLAEREALRASVERYGIDYWVESHDTLFRQLLEGGRLDE